MRRMFVIVAVAAVALAGCGGSKSSSSSAAGQSSATTGASSGGQATATTAAASKASSSGGSSGLGWCGDTTAAQTASQIQPGTDPATLQKNLSLLHKVANEVPSAIRPDMNEIVNVYGTFVTAMSSTGGDPQKLAAALAPLQSQAAALKTASDHIQAYIAANCH